MVVKISGGNFGWKFLPEAEGMQMTNKIPVTDRDITQKRIQAGNAPLSSCNYERAEPSNSPLVAHERERVSARSYARNARLARNNARDRSAHCQPWSGGLLEYDKQGP